MAIRLPSAPTSQSVPSVAPQSDPGVATSSLAFGSGVGAGTAELGGPVMDIGVNIQRRDDALKNAQIRSQRNQEWRESFLAATTSTPGGFSNSDTYKAWLAQERAKDDALLNNYTGSAAGREALAQSLYDLDGRYADLAISEHTRASVALGEKVVNEQAAPLYSQLARDPGSASQIFQQLDALATSSAPMFDSVDDQAIRTQLSNTASSVALESLLTNRKDPESAELMMHQLIQQGRLTGDAALQAQRRVNDAFANRNEFDAKFDYLDQLRAKGYNISKAQELEFLTGIAPHVPASEPLESVIGPDGKPVLMPRSQAAGMQPAPGTPMFTAEPRIAQHEADRVGKAIPEARASIQQRLQRNRVMQEVLATGSFETGDVGGAVKEYVQSWLGVDLGTEAGRQVFGSLGAQDVLDRAQAMTGTLSDNDIRFLQSMAAGNFRGTRANQVLLEINEKLMEREDVALKEVTDYYYANNQSLRGVEEAVQKRVAAEGEILDDSLRSKMAYAQLTPEQQRKIPEDIAKLLVGTAKVTAEAVDAALSQMSDEEISGLPLELLTRIQELFPTAGSGGE